MAKLVGKIFLLGGTTSEFLSHIVRISTAQHSTAQGCYYAALLGTVDLAVLKLLLQQSST